jgi:tRNA threonylcarbamoyladenosine biosynthesis protein TsaE
MFATYTTTSPQATIELGKRLAQRLRGGDIVLLLGDLGSGKTHFAKGLAQGLGIPMTVKSPTYTYVNRFPIPDCRPSHGPDRGVKVFYHYDLYRLKEGDDFASIGLDESFQDPEAISAVEWADRLGGNFPPKHVMVALSGGEENREIRIEFVNPDSLPEASIKAYYEEWSTPANVRRHCRTVAHVAMALADAYVRSGEIVDTTLLYTSSMLHDMARVCDFRVMDRSKFTPPIDDKTWNKWLELREIHQGKDHSDIAAEQLKSRGFTQTAEAIRLHQAGTVILEPRSYDTLEKKILYYADKRVKHEEVVSISERFRDGRERYGIHDSSKEKLFFQDVELFTLELEKELFGGLDLQPEDIQNP